MRRRPNPPPIRLPAGVRVVVSGYVATATTPLVFKDGCYWGQWDHRKAHRTLELGLPVEAVEWGSALKRLRRERERRNWKEWPRALAEARAAFGGEP